ncbi:MAG: site-2 protease family protein, partial [Quinella sp. 1Q5]|nr:site-2 protease family protein [Quinella sp. 1Q5]
MLPIPPLDGSHILRNLLPYELARQYEYLERYSFIFLIIILMTPVLSYIFVPLQKFIFGIFQGIVNILL